MKEGLYSRAEHLDIAVSLGEFAVQAVRLLSCSGLSQTARDAWELLLKRDAIAAWHHALEATGRDNALG